jgi:integrase
MANVKKKFPTVHLRTKALANGRKRLFLDFWPPILDTSTNKETRREFLGLFIYEKPRTPEETKHNRETRALAEKIRAERQLSIQNETFDFSEGARLQTGFVAFMEIRANKKNINTRATWLRVVKILRDYFPNDITFGELSKEKLIAFRDHLAAFGSLAESSKALYLQVLKTTIKDAYKLDYLNKDLSIYLEPIKSNSAQREFLTIEELEKLSFTPCERLDLRTAYLFSCYTGLRFSDIKKLTWKEVQGNEETGFLLRFSQQKSGRAETLPISKTPRLLLGTPTKPDDLVFPTLPQKLFSNDYIILQRWFVAAGISRKLTFHSARHTYATSLLTSGVALDLVSKMLGHTDVKTTQIYAHIIDERRRAAADVFDNLKINNQ